MRQVRRRLQFLFGLWRTFKTAICREWRTLNTIPKATRFGNSVIILFLSACGFVRGFTDCGRWRIFCLKATERALEIVVSEFATNPLPFGALGGFSSYATASKWIDNEVIDISEHADEKLGDLAREARRVGFQLLVSAISDVGGVALRVGGGNQIGRNGATVVILKFVRDVVSRWSHLRFVSMNQQVLHAFRISLKNAFVARFGPWCRREPPDAIDGVFHADTADGDPFRRRGKPCRIPPEEFLGEVEI